MTIYILSQIMYVLGVCVDTFCKALKSQKSIVFFTAIASVFYIMSYVLLKSPLATVANCIILVRAIIYIFLSRKNKPFKDYIWAIALIFVALTISNVFFWTGPLDTFMFVGVMFSTVALACRNTLFLRIGLILAAVFWATYNGILHAYVNMTMDLTNLLVLVVAIFVYNVPHKRDKELLKIKKENEAKENLTQTDTE